MNTIKIFFSLIAAMMLASCATVYNTTNVVVIPKDDAQNISLDVDAVWRVTPFKIEWHSRGMRIEERRKDYQRTDTAIIIHQKKGDFVYLFNRNYDTTAILQSGLQGSTTPKRVGRMAKARH